MPIFTKKLFAEDYVVSSSVVSMSIAQASGSTIFGDSADDTHLFVGNTISGSAASTGSFGLVLQNGSPVGGDSFSGADGTETLFSGSSSSTGSFGHLNIDGPGFAISDEKTAVITGNSSILCVGSGSMPTYYGNVIGVKHATNSTFKLQTDASGSDVASGFEFGLGSQASINNRTASDLVIFGTQNTETMRHHYDPQGNQVGILSGGDGMENHGGAGIFLGGLNTVTRVKICSSQTGIGANNGLELIMSTGDGVIYNRESANLRLGTGNSADQFTINNGTDAYLLTLDGSKISGSATSTGSFGHLLVDGSELASSPNATDGSQDTISGSAVSTGSFGRVSSTTAKIGDAEVRTLDHGKYLFVGADVGTNVEGVTGDALIGFGYDVLSAKPGTARRNVAMGYDNQNVNTNGQYNTSMGWSALKTQGDGDYNTGLGYAALYSSTSASYSTAVGALSLATATTGNGNTAVGYAAAYTLPSTGTGVVALGKGAGQSNTGNNNTFVGYESFNGHNTSNTSNTIIGYRAMYGAGGYEHTHMSNNVAIGHEPAYRFHKGNNNTFIGGGAVAYYYVTGSENTVIGTGTASSLSTGPYDLGHENFIHGVAAGTALDGGQYNILIGRQSGNVLSTGDSNTFVGRQSGGGVTTGFDNVCIGYQSGLNADTNQDSVYVGKTSRATAGAVNEIVIGHDTNGKGSNTVLIGDDNITDIFLSEDKGAIVYGGTFSGSAFVDDGTQLNVPDYVFEPEYDLKSLEYVETHISQSKHLPGVPSRDDKNGWVSYDMGGRDMLLLEKIEELTLYIIDLEKRIKVLEENK